MKTLIAHNLANLESLIDELYKLYPTPCFPSAMALARRQLYELSIELASTTLHPETYNEIMQRLNAIQTQLDVMAKGRCKGIRSY